MADNTTHFIIQTSTHCAATYILYKAKNPHLMPNYDLPIPTGSSIYIILILFLLIYQIKCLPRIIIFSPAS